MTVVPELRDRSKALRSGMAAALVAAMCAACESGPSEPDPVRLEYLQARDQCIAFVKTLPPVAEGQMQNRVNTDLTLKCLKERGFDERVINDQWMEDYWRENQ